MKKEWRKIIAYSVIAFGLGCAGVIATTGLEGDQVDAAQTSLVSESANEIEQRLFAQSPRQYVEMEGKVRAYDGKNITILHPIQGEKTYGIAADAIISDRYIKLKKGVLAEVKIFDSKVYRIETERTIETYGTLSSVDNKKITVTVDNVKKEFLKGKFFYLDKDGYRGSVIGMPVSITLDSGFTALNAEVEDDYDEDYDDDHYDD